MGSDPPDLTPRTRIDRRHNPQVQRVPVAAGSVDSDVFEPSAEQCRHLRLATESISQPVDRIEVHFRDAPQRPADPPVDQAGGLEQRRNAFEDD
jgi:hypothetical protein